MKFVDGCRTYDVVNFILENELIIWMNKRIDMLIQWYSLLIFS